jgi:2-dehydro-3-deoxygluconokinase
VTGRLVTLGETLGVLRALEVGPLRFAGDLRLGVAGAESNVAIGVRRLGHEAAWIGRVGDDEIGAMVVERLRAEGVDVSGVSVDAAATGLMLKERRMADLVRVHYYRAGSAGSRLSGSDVPEALVGGADHLHVTGITPMLSDSCGEAVGRAVAIARGAGLTISLDVNHRSALGSAERLRGCLGPLLGDVDVLFGGEDELLMLTGASGKEAALAELSGIGEVVVKRGGRGASVYAAGSVLHRGAVPVSVVDTVGAGDAFVAGYLAGLLDGSPVEERLRLGVLTGAFAVTVPDDWTGLPRREELSLLEVDPDTTTIR